MPSYCRTIYKSIYDCNNNVWSDPISAQLECIDAEVAQNVDWTFNTNNEIEGIENFSDLSGSCVAWKSIIDTSRDCSLFGSSVEITGQLDFSDVFESFDRYAHGSGGVYIEQGAGGSIGNNQYVVLANELSSFPITNIVFGSTSISASDTIFPNLSNANIWEREIISPTITNIFTQVNAPSHTFVISPEISAQSNYEYSLVMSAARNDYQDQIISSSAITGGIPSVINSSDNDAITFIVAAVTGVGTLSDPSRGTSFPKVNTLSFMRCFTTQSFGFRRNVFCSWALIYNYNLSDERVIATYVPPVTSYNTLNGEIGVPSQNNVFYYTNNTGGINTVIGASPSLQRSYVYSPSTSSSSIGHPDNTRLAKPFRGANSFIEDMTPSKISNLQITGTNNIDPLNRLNLSKPWVEFPNGTRVKIIREGVNGEIVRGWCTDLTDDPDDPNSLGYEIAYNLSTGQFLSNNLTAPSETDTPAERAALTQKFLGPQRYGFGALSQRWATFSLQSLQTQEITGQCEISSFPSSPLLEPLCDCCPDPITCDDTFNYSTDIFIKDHFETPIILPLSQYINFSEDTSVSNLQVAICLGIKKCGIQILNNAYPSDDKIITLTISGSDDQILSKTVDLSGSEIFVQSVDGLNDINQCNNSVLYEYKVEFGTNSDSDKYSSFINSISGDFFTNDISGGYGFAYIGYNEEYSHPIIEIRRSFGECVGTPITITADVSSCSNTTINNIRFYKEGIQVSEVMSYPYEYVHILDNTIPCFYAIVTDSNGMSAQSNEICLSSEICPVTVTITGNGNLCVGSTITITADSYTSNPNASIDLINLYKNGILIGTNSSDQIIFSEVTTGIGNISYYSTSEDTLSGYGSSSSINFNVVACSPTISISGFANGCIGTSIYLEAFPQINNPNAILNKVEIYVNNILSHTITSGPYTVESYANINPGNNTVRAKITDSLGFSSFSNILIFTVDSCPPIITIDTPYGCVGSTVTWSADVSITNPNATIDRVEFYRYSHLTALITQPPTGFTSTPDYGQLQILEHLGTITSAPYVVSKELLLSHNVITAIVFDSFGQSSSYTVDSLGLECKPNLLLSGSGGGCYEVSEGVYDLNIGFNNPNVSSYFVSLFLNHNPIPIHVSSTIPVSSTFYSYTLSPLNSGINSIEAMVIDNFGVRSELSNAISIVGEICDPTIIINDPEGCAGHIVTWEATVEPTIPGATIDRVEFYRNGNLVKTDTTSAYDYTALRTEGHTEINAIVYDNYRRSNSISVDTIGFNCLSIDITGINSCNNNDLILQAFPVNNDPESTIKSVKIFVNNLAVMDVSSGPFIFNMNGYPPDSYFAFASITNSVNISNVSNTISFSIEDCLPTIEINDPESCVGSTVTWTADVSATNKNASIDRVEFYKQIGSSNVLIETVTSAPFILNGILDLGHNVIQGKVYDTFGKSSVYSVDTIGLECKPNITIFGGESGCTVSTSSNFNAIVNINNSNATSHTVYYYLNNSPIPYYISNTPPYDFTMYPLPEGYTNISAKVIDNFGVESDNSNVIEVFGENCLPNISLNDFDDCFGKIVTWNATVSSIIPSAVIDRVEFYRNGYLMKIDTDTPYTLETSLLKGHNVINAIVYDNYGQMNSVSVDSIGLACPPSILLNVSGGECVYDDIVFVANVMVTNPIATIDRVEFFRKSVKVSTITSSPFTYSLSGNLIFGDTELYAIVYDSLGTSTKSESIVITVGQCPPIVSLEVSGSGCLGTQIKWTSSVDLGETNSNIANVYFYKNGTLVHTTNTAPYEYYDTIDGVVNTVFVRAINDLGIIGESSTINVVPENCPPNVSLTIDGSGCVGTDRLVTANVVDDYLYGPLKDVKFYKDGILQYTDISNPYTFIFKPDYNGNEITVVATDAVGLIGVETITISADNCPPNISLKTNLCGTPCVGTSATFFAEIVDDYSGGDIKEVRFYNALTDDLLYTATSYPYEYSEYISNNVISVYSIVEDALGLTATSLTVDVSGNMCPPSTVIETNMTTSCIDATGMWTITNTLSPLSVPLSSISLYFNNILVETLYNSNVDLTIPFNYTHLIQYGRNELYTILYDNDGLSYISSAENIQGINCGSSIQISGEGNGCQGSIGDWIVDVEDEMLGGLIKSIKMYLNGSLVKQYNNIESGTYTYSGPIKYGINTFVVYVEDALGFITSQTNTQVVGINCPPVITLLFDTSCVNTYPTWVAHIDDDMSNGNMRLEWYVNGILTKVQNGLLPGSYSFISNVSKDTVVYAKVIDAMGLYEISESVNASQFNCSNPYDVSCYSDNITACVNTTNRYFINTSGPEITRIDFIRNGSIVHSLLNPSGNFFGYDFVILEGNNTFYAKITNKYCIETLTDECTVFGHVCGPTISLTSNKNSPQNDSQNVTWTAHVTPIIGYLIKDVVFYKNNISVKTISGYGPYNYSYDIDCGPNDVYAVSSDVYNNTSTSNSINIVGNCAPIISITTPITSNIINYGNNIQISANVTDDMVGGDISNVTFYKNDIKTKITNGNGPYDYNFMVRCGSNDVYAIVTDAMGLKTTSNTISITGNCPPSIYLTKNSSGNIFNKDHVIEWEALVSDDMVGGDISKVEYIVDDIVVLEITGNGPYLYNHTVECGVTYISAKVIDALGLQSTTEKYVIRGNCGPSIDILYNTNKIENVNTVIPITFKVYDDLVSDGLLTVDVYFDGNIIKTFNNHGPYFIKYKTLCGVHDFYGVVTDTLGLSAQSQILSITGNCPPNIVLTSSITGNIETDETITLDASVTDDMIGGDIDRVNFISNGIIVETKYDEPYTISYNVKCGDNSIYATVYDALGLHGTSNVINISGTGNCPPTVELFSKGDCADGYPLQDTWTAIVHDDMFGGPLEKVEFFHNNVLVKTITGARAYIYDGILECGHNNVYAIATDSQGKTGLSNIIDTYKNCIEKERCVWDEWDIDTVPTTSEPTTTAPISCDPEIVCEQYYTPKIDSILFVPSASIEIFYSY